MTAPFDGKRFRNLQPATRRSFRDFLRWRMQRRTPPWRRAEVAPGPRPPRRVHAGVRVTYIGHATTLVQMDGLNILTDPIWSERCSPVAWAGPRRVRPPGLRLADLPRIDVVLVSHDHYDHLDLPTLQRLHFDHGPAIYTGVGGGDLMLRNGIGPVHELDWWEEAELSDGVRILGVPAQHFAGRLPWDRNRRLWLGFALLGSHSVYFAGDTGFGAHFASLRERLGPVDVALLPIGAYLPRWFMGPVHLSPDEAVTAHEVLAARRSFAIHFDTFELADEPQGQAPRELAAAVGSLPAERRTFEILEPGEGRQLGLAEARRDVR